MRALLDAPAAFGDTYAQAQARLDSFWQERTARNALGIDDVCYVAIEHGRWQGMLTGYYPSVEREVATLVSLWIDPVARGRMLGERLLESVGDWARGHGSTQMQLWVTETNTAAIALYQRTGFAVIGEDRPLASDPSMNTVLLTRTL